MGDGWFWDFGEAFGGAFYALGPKTQLVGGFYHAQCAWPPQLRVGVPF